MRISDWSSDVCSSDLGAGAVGQRRTLDLVRSVGRTPEESLRERIILLLHLRHRQGFPVLVRCQHENAYMPEYRNQSNECNVRGAGNPRAANVFSPQIGKPRRPAPPWLPPQPENPWPASSSTSCARSTPTASSASPTPVSTWRTANCWCWWARLAAASRRVCGLSQGWILSPPAP